MEIWVDTSDKNTITAAKEMGVLHGVTTNPSIVAKSGKSVEKLTEEILGIQEGPVTVQVTTYSAPEMIKQAKRLLEFSSRILVKIPATIEGLKAMNELSKIHIHPVATCVFHPNQVLLACKAGASYVAPYFSRLNDAGEDARCVLEEMMKIISLYKFPTKLLVASLRSSEQVRDCIDLGAHAMTLNPAVFKEFASDHNLTIQSIERFIKDWGSAAHSELLSEKGVFVPQSADK